MKHRIPTYVWKEERRQVVRINWVHITDHQFKAGPLEFRCAGGEHGFRWYIVLVDGRIPCRTVTPVGQPYGYLTSAAAMRAAPRIKAVRERMGKPRIMSLWKGGIKR